MSVALILLAREVALAAVHAVAAIEVVHAEVSRSLPALDNAGASNMELIAARKPVSFLCVEVAAAMVQVANFALCRAWFAGSICATNGVGGIHGSVAAIMVARALFSRCAAGGLASASEEEERGD